MMAPFVLLASGCSKSEPTPANVPPLTSADRIKSVENDTRLPAEVKAREIARIKAETRQTPEFKGRVPENQIKGAGVPAI
jgi:hypothetical protein